MPDSQATSCSPSLPLLPRWMPFHGPRGSWSSASLLFISFFNSHIYKVTMTSSIYNSLKNSLITATTFIVPFLGKLSITPNKWLPITISIYKKGVSINEADECFLPASFQKQETKLDFLNFIRVCIKKTMVIKDFFQVFLVISQDRCYKKGIA